MNRSDQPVRMVLCKAGLDAHERGVHVLGLGLRDAGLEIIYTGLRRSPEEIVMTAFQEDADVIGISSLSGGHRVFTLRVLELIRAVDADTLVVVGGVVPQTDAEALVAAGVGRVFGAGSQVKEIADYLKRAVAERRGAETRSEG